ncbi:DUF262 domain-containing protein [Culicoidibacter larvae]|uniref:DUF262 domain-containing protein n=1 Tax=Culicoidibacter larvae TaxID=2579976 RepID=A0A5R8QBA5_9FIRM|nr:DUF262 domain-containing protein [Culicoidibacter larvae]TLG73851.1 DUF262 domain-containing protein [Culicoidibacter larvae]
MKAEDRSIERIFSKETRYIIPRYQREYAWTNKEVKKLVEDIVSASSNNYHYFGNIVLVDKSDDNEIKYDVIDGQQRFISIFLLLIAVYKLEPECVDNKLIFTNTGQVKVELEMRAQAAHNNIIEFMLSGEMPETMKLANENKRLESLVTLLKKMKQEEPGILTLIIENFKNTKLVLITFDEESKAHEIFIDLNTKGIPLSKDAIIKSHLFKFLLPEADNADIFKETWGDMVGILQGNTENYIKDMWQLRKNIVFSGAPPKEKTKVFEDILNTVNDEDTATTTFDLLTRSVGDIAPYRLYESIKRLPIASPFNQDIIDAGINVISSDWDIIKSLSVKQFDILLFSLLYVPKSKKNVLVSMLSNYPKSPKIQTFIRFIVIHNLFYSIINKSPSAYGIQIYGLAKKISDNYTPKNISSQIKKFTENIYLKGELAQIKASLLEMEINDEAKKEKKIARGIFKVLFNDFNQEFIEHIHCQSDDTITNRFNLGNILLVTHDDFGEYPIERKIVKYNEQSSIGNVKDFLSKYDNTFSAKDIDVRTNDLADRILEEYTKLFKILTT